MGRTVAVRRELIWVLALLTASTAALAQPVSGLYVGVGAGLGLQQDEVAQPNPAIGRPHANFWSFAPGFSGEISLGYGFGNGLRAELEGDFLSNGVDRYFPTGIPNQAHGTEHKYGGMVNVLYDLSIGLPVVPYAGLGVGAQAVQQNNFGQGPVGFVFPGTRPATPASQTVGAFAYQAILGAALPLAGVPGLSLTAEYRFLGLGDPYPSYNRVALFANGSTAQGKVRFGNNYNDSFLVGLRYAFGAPTPPAQAPMAAPAPVPARSYLVFFDWDKATLTPRAQQIIGEAAANSTKVKYTQIEVNGYTDTSGSPQYNQGLSIRRAQAVAAELIKDGVPKNSIAIQGYGETHLLVSTGPEVREPQNRRVEIIIG
jgi:outer membrane protein OmpA-like peptidoglycan-associated protein